MRTSVAYGLLLSGAAVHALPEIAIAKHRDAGVNPARLKRRQNGGGTVETNTYDVLTWSTGGAYYANVTVGTPPQEQVVILDTGSSDLYFDSSTAKTCQGTGLYSCRGGTFDHADSSTYKIVAQSPAFNTSFGDGSTAVGPFAEDVIGIGDVRIDGVQFGVADEVDSTTGYAVGLMGLGYSENEASQRQYPNIPEVLASSGEINSRLYSIYLNDIDATSGTVLFGGIDKSKFTSPLTTINLLPSLISGNVLQFITTVTGLSATVNGGEESTIFSGGTDSTAAYGSNDAALAVLLDTGSSAWSLPTQYYEKGILPLFPYVTSQGLCDCKYRDSNDSLTVEFAAKISINVPARQFIVPIYDPATNEPQYFDAPRNTQQACAFMLTPSESSSQGFLTLGDAVLRSMYVVYDLDNGQLSLAQADLDSSKASDIVTVQAGLGGVQKAVGGGSSASVGPNRYSIAPAVSGGESFTASSVQSTVGMATGTDAVPADARVSETGAAQSSAGGGKGGSGNGGGSGGGAASSSAAANVVRVGGFGVGAGADMTGLHVAMGVVVLGGMMLGGALIL